MRFSMTDYTDLAIAHGAEFHDGKNGYLVEFLTIKPDQLNATIEAAIQKAEITQIKLYEKLKEQGFDTITELHNAYLKESNKCSGYQQELIYKESRIKELEGFDECICKGNWRAIVKESQPLIGKSYKGTDGKVWTFFGVVDGADDYYYGMNRKGKLLLLSCVGNIENYGFELIAKRVEK